MALELKQQLKQTQQLLMSPQLQQAIKLLQMSRLELVEHIQQELLENPFLEEVQGSPELSDVDENFSELNENRASSEADEGYSFEEINKNGDWEDYLGELSSAPKTSSAHEYESIEDNNFIETRYAEKSSLDDHLMWQLRLSSFTEEELDICENIIGNLDSCGYLRAELSEIAEATRRSAEKVEELLYKVQRLDPVGVAARTPQECLLVQVEVLKYDRDPVLVELIKYHLTDLETHRYKPLLRKFHLDMETLKEYLDIIQSLDPMPGASFGESEPLYVSPDVYVFPSDGDFVILLNDEDIPNLRLNDFLDKGNVSAEVKDFTNKKIASASWLIKSLEQRKRTLYKVVESIVKFQRSFFEEGVDKLKPLILKDIAEDIEMHESSVSRITTNKYVSTPHGVFELKFFFNSALSSDNGDSVGSESVKALIKKMIGKEDPKNPLADEKLCELLKQEIGVDIARRTVAKYRTALNIPSSSKRKQRF